MPYKDPEQAKAHNKAYYAAHREEQRAYSNAYEEAHKEERKAYVRTPSGRFRTLKSLAKQRLIGVTLTKEEHASILEDPCYLCGKPNEGAGGGIDRLDSEIGYTFENSASCCGSCNQAKNDLPLEQFLDLCARITENFKNQ
jgi:hypothetical protein